MIIGTVVTRSHVSRAKVLAQSIKFHHPEIKVIVSLVERFIDPETAEFPCFDEVVLAQDTWKGNFDQVLFKYETWEACCFAKGPLMSYIFDKYPEENHVLFLDSDTDVVAPLYDLMDRFERSSVLLTPQHLSKGSEHDDFKYGIFNAGLIGASRTDDGLAFVRWWTKRLERHAYFEEYDRLFAEQKWLNLVPSFFRGVEVIQHPGYNVAAWNFGQRKVEITDGGRYTVNGEPLYIFHFHAFGDREREANDPDYEKWQPALYKLIKEYAARLDTIGRRRTLSVPWTYQFFTSGEPIARNSRLVYRNNRYLESRYPNPFLLSNEFFAKFKDSDKSEPVAERRPIPVAPIPDFKPRPPYRRIKKIRKRKRRGTAVRRLSKRRKSTAAANRQTKRTKRTLRTKRTKRILRIERTKRIVRVKQVKPIKQVKLSKQTKRTKRNKRTIRIARIISLSKPVRISRVRLAKARRMTGGLRQSTWLKMLRGLLRLTPNRLLRRVAKL